MCANISRNFSDGMENNVPHLKWSTTFFWLIFIMVAAFLFMASNYPPTYQLEGPKKSRIVTMQGFVIATKGCKIPNLPVTDQKIKKYMEAETFPKCGENDLPPLVASNLTSIYVINSSLAEYNVEDIDLFVCCYRVLTRIVPKYKQKDNLYKYSETCWPFLESINIYDEFIKVSCEYKNESIYKDFFSFVPLKQNVSKTNWKREPLNVLVIGLDAVSRLNFHRQMPNTVEYLKNISAIELLGYNKVADNTFPNLMPILTGKFEEELKKSCWKKNGHFDKCHFIWEEYKKRGFVTAFNEDASWMGVFQYCKLGFQHQPTDYMWGFYDRVIEKEIGNHKKMNLVQCAGTRRVYRLFLDYITKFVIKMHQEKLPFFSFNWGASLSHDYFNKPRVGDDDYLHFFQNLKNGGFLNNTILVFMSDHGIRWGSFRQTYQGGIEERLPFVFMVLPEWYKKEFSSAHANLLRNTRVLTTPFDLHETLIDLMKPYNINSTYLLERSKNKNRGYSLFSRIRSERTCSDAAIESHWCTCQVSTEIDVNNTSVRTAASFMVEHMNKLLMNYTQCANLSMDTIISARMLSTNFAKAQKDVIKDYMLSIRTVPGEGVFEGTVRVFKGHYEIVGTISRLNRYGDQSRCVSDFHMKLYCYCTEFKLF